MDLRVATLKAWHQEVQSLTLSSVLKRKFQDSESACKLLINRKTKKKTPERIEEKLSGESAFFFFSFFFLLFSP